MAKDLFHDTVRKALEKEEWIITFEPITQTILDFGQKLGNAP